MRIVAIGLMVVLVVSPVHSAVLKDHVSVSSLWDGIDLTVTHQYRFPAAAESPIAASAFTGDGQILSRVSVIWAIGDTQNPANIDFSRIDWKFLFYPDVGEFGRDPLGLQPLSPSYVASFDVPVNGDWTVPVGETGQKQPLYYAEVDITHLGISTVASQQHLLALIPDTNRAASTNATSIAFSTGGAGSVGHEIDWFFAAPNGLGPIRFDDLGSAFYDQAAYRIETVPEPGALLLFLIGVASLRRTS